MVGADAMKTYRINEVFYSLQGEGARSGEPSVFIRFSGCNMTCAVEPSDTSPGGFNCDTEFVSGRSLTAEQLIEEIEALTLSCRWLVLTGGEPLLQLDRDLILTLKAAGYFLAIETNGTKEIPSGLDWVCVSPKVAEHAVVPTKADEVKYVRAKGQGIPRPAVKATHKYLSPAFDSREVAGETLQWCIGLCLENPEWRLSVQDHNLWNVR